MNCIADIKALAGEKILDAECLEANGRTDGAYYMAGYAIEMYLKARVCKNLGIDDFFADITSRQKPKGQGDINKAFKVHDLDQLLLLSGIFMDFENSTDRQLKSAWNVIRLWSEQHRYKTGKQPREAADLIRSIKIFEAWILNYL